MRWLCVLLFCVSPVQADDASGWREHITFSLTERVRGEFVDWFAPPPSAAARGAERYAFFASQLRAGVRVLYSPLEVAIEMQDTRFAGLPSDATLGPPHGALGPGATYFLYTHDTSQGEPFLKQGNVTLRLAGVTATLGRFEYRDGLETLPADGTLLALKRSRIAERLVGSFDFTHVSRSMDGGRIAYDRPDWNLTAFAARPTEGGFEVSANRQLDDIGLIGLALGLKRLPFAFPFDGRLFYLYYDDQRRGALKVDNRPLPVRQTDRSRLAIHTIGAHALTVLDLGPGRLDLLTWAAAQTGQWGAQDHNAWAYAIEAGYAWPRVPWTPWVRLGFDGSSGDTNPNDRHHDTFFQVLPTARTYAAFPFYNAMNNQDLLAELILRPHAKVTVKAEYHYLRLSSRRDLWYAGGGAGNDQIFGYAGVPANGRRDLAQVASLAISAAVLPTVTVAGFYGHAFGGDVIGKSFADRDADYGFVEATFRY